MAWQHSKSTGHRLALVQIVNFLFLFRISVSHRVYVLCMHLMALSVRMYLSETS